MTLPPVRHTLSRLSMLILAVALTFAAAVHAQRQSPNPTAGPKAPAAEESPSGPAAQTGKEAAGKVVLKVGTESFTAEQLSRFMGRPLATPGRGINYQGLRPVVEQYANLLVLFQEAERQHLENTGEVKEQLEEMRRRFLAQAEYQNLSRQAKVEPEEVNQYYSSHPTEFDETQYRQVFVRKKAEGAKEGTPGLSPSDARTRAEAVRKALTGGADAKAVAKEMGGSDVVIDSEPRKVRQSRAIPGFEKEGAQLKDGELSEIHDNPTSLVFIQMAGHRRADLSEAKAEIENKLHQQKMESMLADLKKKNQVWIDEDFFKAAPPPAVPGSSVTPPQPAAPVSPKL